MGALNVFFARSMMALEHFSFRLLFPPPFGPMNFSRPPIFSIGDRAVPMATPHCLHCCLERHQTTHTCGFLAACVTQTASHKLAPRSVRCVFLGYLADQRGYKCYDPESECVIISRHVYFDEHSFPFAQVVTTQTPEHPNCPPCHTEFLPVQSARRQRTPRAP